MIYLLNFVPWLVALLLRPTLVRLTEHWSTRQVAVAVGVAYAFLFGSTAFTDERIYVPLLTIGVILFYLSWAVALTRMNKPLKEKLKNWRDRRARKQPPRRNVHGPAESVPTTHGIGEKSDR